MLKKLYFKRKINISKHLVEQITTNTGYFKLGIIIQIIKYKRWQRVTSHKCQQFMCPDKIIYNSDNKVLIKTVK